MGLRREPLLAAGPDDDALLEAMLAWRYVPPFKFYYDKDGETTGALKEGGTQHIAWRVVAAEFVTTDTGTGVVHQAPAFGEVDYDVLLAEQLRFGDDTECRFDSQAAAVFQRGDRDRQRHIGVDESLPAIDDFRAQAELAQLSEQGFPPPGGFRANQAAAGKAAKIILQGAGRTFRPCLYP